MSDPIIHKICAGFSRYYARLEKDYDKTFSTYCDENGLDDEAILEELQQDPTDCVLIEFDENGVPFEKEPKDKVQKIFDLITMIKDNPDVLFGDVKFPIFDGELFDIDEKELDQIKEVYQRQCPVLWNSGMDGDDTLLQILAVGRKHKFDYLGHLVDDYARHRIEHIDTGYNEVQWADPGNHKHFRKLKNVTVRIPKKEYIPSWITSPNSFTYKHIGYNELASAAVKSFGARCCAKLLLSSFIKINDSIETAIKYIAMIVEFIGNTIDSKETLPPFQMDFCMAFGAPLNMDIKMGIDGGDDDDDDAFIDCIGNIKKKLTKNNLKHQYKPYDPTQEKRFFVEMFKNFKKEQNEEQFGYPHNKRFVTFIDRRKEKEDDEIDDDEKKEKEDDDNNFDDVWMYEAPKNCRDIPNDVVPEWHIGASRTSLLPDLEYGDGKKAEQKEDKGKETKDKLKKSNIGASFHCKGSLLTLSFIVKEADAIKCYLYWNGQIIRFMAEDVTTVFPKMFNMKWNDGKKLVRKKPVRYEKAKVDDKGNKVDDKGKKLDKKYFDDKGHLLDDKGNKTEIIEYEPSVNELYLEHNKEEIKDLVDTMNKILKDKYFEGFKQTYLSYL